FFFSSRRRHTRWPRDWSSDVCSSDLRSGDRGATDARLRRRRGIPPFPPIRPRSAAAQVARLPAIPEVDGPGQGTGSLAEKLSEASVSPVPTDEIYEKYRDKAILEINALGDELARAAAGRVPVLGSGHPLGDILLLKYRPQPAEVQEGVAFYGRAGQAI